jgi:hypothetical protein
MTAIGEIEGQADELSGTYNQLGSRDRQGTVRLTDAACTSQSQVLKLGLVLQIDSAAREARVQTPQMLFSTTCSCGLCRIPQLRSICTIKCWRCICALSVVFKAMVSHELWPKQARCQDQHRASVWVPCGIVHGDVVLSRIIRAAMPDKGSSHMAWPAQIRPHPRFWYSFIPSRIVVELHRDPWVFVQSTAIHISKRSIGHAKSGHQMHAWHTIDTLRS